MNKEIYGVGLTRLSDIAPETDDPVGQVSINLIGRRGDPYMALRAEIFASELNAERAPETSESIAEVRNFLNGGMKRGSVLITGAPHLATVSEHLMRQAAMDSRIRQQAIDELLETPGATFDTSPRTERVVGKSGYTYPRAKQGRRR